MRTSLGNASFSRKIIGYYLLFCVLAIGWLLVSVLATSHDVVSKRTTSSILSRLGQLAPAIELDLLRNDGQSIQELLDKAASDGQLAACALVENDGRFLAHTNRILVGTPSVERAGKRLQRGSVQGVQYTDDFSRMISEYRVPLSVSGRKNLSLRLSVIEPDFWVIASQVLDAAPIALLIPIFVIGGGCYLLRRLTMPLAEIENQLQAIAKTPFGQPVSCTPVIATGRAAAGWNRLSEEFLSDDRATQQDSAGGGGRPLEQKIAEALSARQQHKSLEILQALGEGIAVTDASGRIEFANAAVAALIGGEGLAEASGSSGLENVQLTLAELLLSRSSGAECFEETSSHMPVVGELESGSDDGKLRVLRVERQPLDDSAGRAVWSLRDVTQQKLAEKSRDQFIDAATHELRTPLANIKAYAETLAECVLDDPEQQKEFYNTINSEATRLARFVDDLLDVSSMEVGSLMIRRQNVEVERLCREALDKVRPLMDKKDIQLEQVLPPKLGESQLDKDKISVLLVNLLGNAAKYTPEGGRVRFKAEATEDSFTMRVEDTGFGISEEELPKIFDKFFRSDNEAVRDVEGTGLGLSMAREIARLHGGDIAVESKLGEGSAFTLTLPRAAGGDA